MTRTATPAQTARIANARSEAKMAGGYITTRHLPNGDVRITEHSGGKKGYLDIRPDGQPADTTTTAPAQEDELTPDAEAMTVAAVLDALPAHVRAAVVAGMSREERSLVAQAAASGRQLQAAAKAA